MNFAAKNVRVAMVEPVGGHRGNELYDFGLCKALAEEGYAVTLYTCDETHIDEQFSFPFAVKKVFVNIYGKTNKYLRGINFLLGIRRVLADIRRQHCQLVHMHFYHFTWLEYIMLRRFSQQGQQVVGTVHDVETFDKYGKEIDKKKYQKFEKLLSNIIVHTPYAKESLLKYFTNTNPDKIHIVPHGDTDFLYSTSLTKTEARQQLRLPEEKNIILFFGQIKKVKGVEVLLKAFINVLRHRQDVHLMVSGNPWKHDMADIYQLIKDEQLENNGTFIFDYIPNDHVPVYFRAADIVVLPYLKIYSSGVLLRAMNYGSCIIASDTDAFKTVIKDRYNGALFTTGDENDLAEKINSLLNHKTLREVMTINAQKTIKENFSWKIVGQKTTEVYQNALQL
jgi:glycosyltransferase involved in cell wall biosynthesis